MAAMMQTIVADLCSEECAGRAPGTPGGAAARRIVVEAMRAAGLDPYEQEVPGCGGANVIARVDGSLDRYVIVGAHFDHLGRRGNKVYWGADDNAAAVAVLVEVGRALAKKRQDGRGVILAAFDGEEPPHFMNAGMGSMELAKKPPVPLDRVDMMVCMDLVGHALGPEGLPDSVRTSLFALGAERSAGTAEVVDRLAKGTPGVMVRRADAEIVPPLSDYEPFWRREVPFLFLTGGRWRHYHTPEDTPEKLDYPKMEATARWLERFVRETCARPEPRIAFEKDGGGDAGTLRSIADLLEPLAAVSEEAAMARSMARELLGSVEKSGRLPAARRGEMFALIGAIEEKLA
jgi:hypothetical protein